MPGQRIRNPVEAAIVKKPEDYFWSSYRYYIDSAEPCIKLAQLRDSVSSEKYKLFVNKGNSQFISDFYSKAIIRTRL